MNPAAPSPRATGLGAAPADERATRYGRMRLIFGHCALARTCAFGAVVAILVSEGDHRDESIAVTVNPIAAAVGVPLGALIARFDGPLPRTVRGPIEVESFGLEFKRGSAPIVMGVFRFMALAWAISGDGHGIGPAPPGVPRPARGRTPTAWGGEPEEPRKSSGLGDLRVAAGGAAEQNLLR
jgi:hypothetical protein